MELLRHSNDRAHFTLSGATTGACSPPPQAGGLSGIRHFSGQPAKHVFPSQRHTVAGPEVKANYTLYQREPPPRRGLQQGDQDMQEHQSRIQGLRSHNRGALEGAGPNSIGLLDQRIRGKFRVHADPTSPNSSSTAKLHIGRDPTLAKWRNRSNSGSK